MCVKPICPCLAPNFGLKVECTGPIGLMGQRPEAWGALTLSSMWILLLIPLGRGPSYIAQRATGVALVLACGFTNNRGLAAPFYISTCVDLGPGFALCKVE